MQVIKDQIFAACLGVQETVDTIQTRTGVKDKTASFWIEKLVLKAKDMQKARISDPRARDPQLANPRLKGKDWEDIKSKIKSEIQQELFQWVILQPPERHANIPGDDRKQFTEIYFIFVSYLINSGKVKITPRRLLQCPLASSWCVAILFLFLL